MNKRAPTPAIAVTLSILLGIALRFVVNLEPVWWLAWFVPGLLLALVLRLERGASRLCIAIAAAIGVSVNAPYFLSVMPLPATILVLALQVLLWLLLIGGSRRILQTVDSSWAALAFPVIGVAVDTLLAHFTPDGNWGSLAYTQADVLPVAQLASVFGMEGVLFVLLLVNSTLAMLIHRGVRTRGAALAAGLALLVVVATVSFGAWRLREPARGQVVTFGIAAIDDFLADAASEKSAAVWRQYESQVSGLAQRGAKFVLLPEKISVLPVAAAEDLKHRLGALARANHVWLVAGLGVDDGKRRRNEAWWFSPDGLLATNYLKHHMAPPEREFVPGDEFSVNEIDGRSYGVAICKDMHFASLGRQFARRGAAVMLVPAWDFRRDAWMAANITKMRGVEGGFSIVRASRDGLLSVSDAYGRMRSVAASAAMPGATLLAGAPVGPRITTIYTRLGDALGWACVAGLLIGTAWSLRRRATPIS